MSHTSSNATGITYATNIDSADSVRSNSMGSIQSTLSSYTRRLTLNTTQSRQRQRQQQQQQQSQAAQQLPNGTINNDNNGKAKIFNYNARDYIEYNTTLCCEDICIELCRSLGILPGTRLLFGLRTDQDGANEWLPPKAQPSAGQRYCFRMRFQVPALDEHLLSLDLQAFDYLYRQIRYDMVNERIPELRYPAHKDSVVGFAVLDMYVDYKEGPLSSTQIESDYVKYLPRKIVKAHWMFLKGKIRANFGKFIPNNYDLSNIKLIYVKEVHSLAPNYLLERYAVTVDYIPGDEDPLMGTQNNCFLKLDLHDTQEPGLKIARIAAEDKLKWFLVGTLEHILSLYTTDGNTAQLEITGFPSAYGIQFGSTGEMKSFITYVYGYKRLTSNWIFNLSAEYETPSLKELTKLRCHGPVGGAFSFAKIWEKRNECGTYLIRQCEKEYNIYYIDINNKSKFHAKSCKTETFKIERKDDKWILDYNDSKKVFNSLREVEEFIPTEAPEKLRLPPSPYDKPPLLLICLPKNLLTKKTDQKMSYAELARQRVQVFYPLKDLQCYKNSVKECDNGHMTKYKADWILQGSFGEVPVTLKILNPDKGDSGEFMSLTNTWSQIYSPQFIKLYGLTLEKPYTMILEYEKDPLNEFLQKHKDELTKKCILDVILALVRAIVYLKEMSIFHGFIRCQNIYVTNFEADKSRLETKIADPGYPRPYGNEDRPWIPLEHHNDLQMAKHDPTTDFWAFATTLWEIVTFGESIRHYTTEQLHANLQRYGGILPQRRDIPEDLYLIMMDGWNRDEPDERFNHHKIFVGLNSIKDDLYKKYSAPEISSSLVLDDEEIPNSCENEPSRASTFAMATRRGQLAPVAPKENYLKNIRQVLEIPGGKVIYRRGDLLGEGHYGTVYHGILQYDDNQCKKVAIKSLKAFDRSQLNDDFMREIKIMENLDHPNIVKIIAWVDEPLSIIMEYVQSGSLYVYVSSGKPNLTNETLMQFAMDIAKGMAYLCTKNIIHRDLAARNILIDNDRAKISDFGLAQIANSHGYYIAKSVREIPIKWYAPEVIETSKYSFNSDVWSYGVTLFEMYSRGNTPNLEPDRELSQNEFLTRLKKKQRLSKPPLCPDNVYDKLMLRCWEEDPKRRPNFDSLIKEIQSIMDENGESVRN